MKISSKSILSPGRAGVARDPPNSLSTSLSRRLRNSGSIKGGASPAMFPTTAKKRGSFENPEPSSPKVTCIGQVRVKSKKKQAKKLRTLSRRHSAGEVSFRNLEHPHNGFASKTQNLNGSLNLGSNATHQNQNQEYSPPQRSWVHFPVTICDALRALGSEFSCLFPCRKDEKTVSTQEGNRQGCAVFARWLVAVQDGDGGGQRALSSPLSVPHSRRTSVAGDMEDIEDLLVGGGAAPPGFRLPITAAVGINPMKKKKNNKLEPSSLLQNSSTHQVPGTQTIFLKTFGCSHNQSDSEYMAGQLSSFGYAISDNAEGADLWLINTCTVKSPSQSAMDTLISKCKSAKKPLVVAGCVPQGSRDLKELEGVSIVGVQQIDRVVEVVEETLKGHEVRLLNRKTLPSLDLPKVRKNKFVEILPINVGCLGACTYCKTKHARGHLGSYTVDSLVGRVKSVVDDGVKEIWLSSEDTGAYGRDIGVNLPILLNAIVGALPSNGSTMLRIGMTNPPYILEHLKEIAEILRHPCVYSFLHVPVQSGSDAILTAMKREYTAGEFRMVVDTLTELVPGMQIATDIICGFPGETDEDFAQTVDLIKEYKFSQVHISQFYPRPGTPAARMKKVASNIVKKRSRELTSVFESFTPYNGMEGNMERIWITDIATDEIHLVGHTKGYVQVLVVGPESLLGSSAIVKITSVGRWSVFGDVIKILDESQGVVKKDTSNKENCSPSPCFDQQDACACSEAKPESCACGSNGCDIDANANANDSYPEAQKAQNIPSLLLRRKPSLTTVEMEDNGNQKVATSNMQDRDWGVVDKLLVGGIFLSLLTMVALILYVRF